MVVSTAFSCLHNLCFPQKCSLPTYLLYGELSLQSTGGGIKHTETGEHAAQQAAQHAQGTAYTLARIWVSAPKLPGWGHLHFRARPCSYSELIFSSPAPTVSGGSRTHCLCSLMTSRHQIRQITAPWFARVNHSEIFVPGERTGECKTPSKLSPSHVNFTLLSHFSWPVTGGAAQGKMKV